MKHWLLLLLMVALAYAQTYYAPPIHFVMENNLNLGSALDNHYDASNAVSFPLPYHPGYVNASVSIAGMSFLMDNATYAETGSPGYPALAVLIARGVQVPPDIICNYSYRGAITFRFKNLTYQAPFPSMPMPTRMEVPSYMLERMKDSSGADQLEVGLTSIIRFVTYDDGVAGSGCNESDFFYGPPLRAVSRNFTVYGTNELFFLRAPVLREQWFRDNRFDIILLSQSPLYHADIMLNGNITRNLTLRTFSVITNSYGIEEVVSNLSAPDGWSEAVNLTTPLPLEGSAHSFAYVYSFNYSYEGLGQNILSLVVNDSLRGSARHDEVLLSRMLSYNGTTTEAGSPASSVPSRPSASFSQDYLSPFELVLGILALLIVLSFVNVWLLK